MKKKHLLDSVQGRVLMCDGAMGTMLQAEGLSAGEWQEISRLFEQLTEMQFSRQDIPAYDLDRTQKTLLQYIKGKIIIGNP